jgi:serine/threonine protein kinase
VKPENVVLRPNGQAVLVDLNISRKVSNAERDTMIMGTVGYASPEQLGLTQSDARTDIYACGVLLNVMLTGKHPSEQLARGRAGRIVRRCTAVNPDDRYPSAKRLAMAL